MDILGIWKMKYAVVPDFNKGGTKKILPGDKNFDSDKTLLRSRYLFLEDGKAKEGFILPCEYNEEIEKEVKKAGYTYSDGVIWTKDHKWVKENDVIKSDIASDSVVDDNGILTNSKMGTINIVDDLLEINLIFIKAYFEKI